MRRRRGGMAKAVTGVVLAGGALGALLWWNAGGWRSSPAVASAGVSEQTSEGSAVTSGTATEAAGNPSRQDSALDSTLTVSTPSPSNPSPEPLAAATQATSQPAGTAGVARPSGPTVGTAVTGPWVLPNTITAASPESLKRGKELVDAGKLLEARTLLNGALIGSEFNDPGDAEAAKALLREINGVLVFSPERIAGDPWVDEVVIRPGDRLTKVANDIDVPYELILKINGIADARRVRAGQRLKVIKGPIHAVVSKSRFTIDLYFGSPGGPDSVYLTSFRVGLGTNDSTPTGLWKVAPENKLKNPTYFSPRGEGVIHADDPQNPLGEYWIGLTGIEGAAVGKLSYGIHGTIEPDSIGKMASMGCIRLLNDDVGQLFTLLFEGRSTVRVVE